MHQGRFVLPSIHFHPGQAKPGGGVPGLLIEVHLEERSGAQITPTAPEQVSLSALCSNERFNLSIVLGRPNRD